MLATFAIEIILAIYTLWRYKLNETSRLVIAILVGLSIFQLAEYMVCGGLGVSSLGWARLGYVAITLLPPLGIHLATVLAKKSHPWLLAFSYICAALFIIFFAFITSSITGQVCGGNYIIFNIAPGSSYIYGLYYYGLLLTSVILCWKWARADKKVRQPLQALAVGYIVFLLPTTTVNLLDSSTMRAIPSIMCGFAVLLALVLAFWILPLSAKKRR